MPIYLFECKSCGDAFEDFRSVAQKTEAGKCLSCGSADIARVENVTPGCGCGCGCSDGPGHDHASGAGHCSDD